MVVMFDCVTPPVVFVSALLRTIGNYYKLTELIGGQLMGTIETKKDTNLTNFAMETLLVVGNLGVRSLLTKLG